MPLEFHQEETSGALAAKVNNGVGRIVQTGEPISRDLCPALIRTGFSLIPLLIFGLSTAPILLGALLTFGWLTILENRNRRRWRRHRHENYGRDAPACSVDRDDAVGDITDGGKTVSDDHRGECSKKIA